MTKNVIIKQIDGEFYLCGWKIWGYAWFQVHVLYLGGSVYQ